MYRSNWASLAGGHVQCFKHQLRAQVVGHFPADDLSAVGIDHDGQVQVSFLRRHIGDVSDPEFIRTEAVKSRSTSRPFGLAGKESVFAMRSIHSGLRRELYTSC